MTTGEGGFIVRGPWRSFMFEPLTDRLDCGQERTMMCSTDSCDLSFTVCHYVGNYADVLRQADPHLDDARWRCASWQQRMARSEHLLRDAFASELSFVGEPLVTAETTEVSHGILGWLSWSCGERDGFSAMVSVSGAATCGSCFGCRALSRPSHERGSPHVYFIQAANGGPIKVGHSANVDARVSTLQTAHPYPIRVLATVPGGVAMERAIHKAFSKDRMGGEWFRESDELKAFIRELGSV